MYTYYLASFKKPEYDADGEEISGFELTINEAAEEFIRNRIIEPINGDSYSVWVWHHGEKEKAKQFAISVKKVLSFKANEIK